MASASNQLDPNLLDRWHADHAVRLKAFLVGLLKDVNTAEEVFQKTFTKALTHGGAVENGKEKAWLFQVAYHEAMAIKRKKGVIQRAVNQLQLQVATRFLFPDELQRTEIKQQVQAALQQLPESQQQIIRLRFQEDLTFQQIADQLNQPLGTVLTRSRTALKKLREVLKDLDTW